MVAPERVIRSFVSASQLAAERVDVFPEEGAIRKLMEILELPPTALVTALVTLQLCDARYHRGGPVYWSADMPQCLYLATGQHLSLPV